MSEQEQTRLVFRDLFSACKLYLRSPDFNEEHFPLESSEPDDDEWEPFVHHFDQPVYGDVALEQLQDLDYRFFKGPRRAMQYLADWKKKGTLVVTAFWNSPDGYCHAPVVGDWSNDSMSDWGLVLWRLNAGHKIYPGWDWLVLRKKDKK